MAVDILATANATLTTIAKALDYFKSNVASHLSDTSLASITKLTRSEPLAVISQDVANLKQLELILDNLTSVYSGFYLQAVAILTNVNNIEVIRTLDRLNPDRDSTGFLLQGRQAVLESMSYRLHDQYKYRLPGLSVAKEASYDNVTTKTIYETANLAVGKLINVTIQVEGSNGEVRDVVIPVSVRLSPAILNQESLNYLFTNKNVDRGIVEQYHSWRAGRIKLIDDVILCNNIIREYRKAALKDRSGVLTEINRRAAANRAYGLLTKNPSLATVSNIYVLSTADVKRIEMKTGMKFADIRSRSKLTEGTYAMVIAVVDTESETVTYYYDGIALPSKISFRALESKSKKGADVGDIMRSLLEGRAPTF